MTDAVAEQIRGLMARGEFLAAADMGHRSIGDEPDGADVETVWLTGLALARCGAPDRAQQLLDDARLVDRAAGAPPALRDDVLALQARLVKDRALAATGSSRRTLAREAAAAYVAIDATSSYALVNAATMLLIAGDHDASQTHAARALSVLGDDNGDGDYWSTATRAEALLLLGRGDDAAHALAAAAAMGADWSMRSTTKRQLALVAREADMDLGLLDALPVPSVAHYSGHMFASGPEDELRERIADELRERNVGAVHGSLACGSDLLVVEAALGLGIEVHAVLPCPVEAFVARSVRPGGPGWLTRFDAALAAASSIVTETTVALPDETMFGYADQLAMGFALARAEHLGSEAFQIALWDGVENDGEAGTGAAVARWARTGHATTVIDLPRDRLTPVTTDPNPAPVDGSRPRTIKAMLFADVKGFSALGEDELPAFFEKVMARLARVIDTFGGAVDYRNTWGDAIYLVMDRASDAARLALALQEELRAMREPLGMPGLTARIGGHAGPVFDGYDYVNDEPTYYGTHVTRAARIEPGTPPGEVYVTEHFAALVALDGIDGARLEYVGHVPTAKDYGAFPMYVLRR
ncbi:MAG: adenylate/guanylate cyclase domain-containing protein [Acidimicrobiales bacterium]